MSFETGFAAQAPSLPHGGAATSGLGETFTPDLSTGTGKLVVPIDLPNGPNDIAPKLSLRYDSGGANGPFGLGWSLTLPRISRSTTGGLPRYDDTDTIILEGSGPLVWTGNELRPEVETGEWRIEDLAGAGGLLGSAGFRVTDRAGTRYLLGTTADSRVPGLGGLPLAWQLARIEDNLGETAAFSWRTAGSQRYLERIEYGRFSVRFEYEARPDPLRWSRAGFVQRTDLRCARIELHLADPPAGEPSLVRRWSLEYSASDPAGASLLSTVSLTGTAADGATLSTPPLRLTYAAAAPPTLTAMALEDDRSAPPTLVLRGTGRRVELIDWTGDGTADVVEVSSAGIARVWPNHAGAWGRPIFAGAVPQLADQSAAIGIVDLDGDGLADLVRADVPARGYQPRTASGFGRPVRWARAPSVAFGSESARMVDLDGDGIGDLVWGTGRSLLLARRTEDAAGWVEVPDVVPSTPSGPPADLADPHLHAADMTGDGTPDIVRVDGAGVTYWPYLGRGDFGEAVRMGASPVLPYDVDPSRIIVVDVDGDGCADVVLLDEGRVQWWPNVAGDHFAAPRQVDHLPTGAMDDVRVADVRGTGTPALVWSATLASGRGRWFALDLVGGSRPGLLTEVDTLAGRVTTIEWTTSAREAERDRAAGVPWRSRLPVVLPIVAAMTVSEPTTETTTATRFSYHEGRYDGALREVCGFGRVEAVEAGDEHVASSHTLRWFHNGADPETGAEPSTDDQRRRLRSIRGRLLKQENGPALANGIQGPVFKRMTQEWRVDDAASSPVDAHGYARIVAPRLVKTSRWTFEGAAVPVAVVVSEQVSWDKSGNLTEAVESAYDLSGAPHAPGDPLPVPAVRLRTFVQFASAPEGRFRQRQARVVQVDGNGAVVADTRTEYDGLALGRVGAQGLVTARESMAITDALAVEVYGGSQPEWAALGYLHRDAIVAAAGATGIDAVAVPAGWWVRSTKYSRTVGADRIVRGTTTNSVGAVTEIELDPSGCYPARVRDAVGNEIRAEFDLRSYQPLRLVEASGAVSRVAFDALTRLVTLVEPGDDDARPTASYTYDASDLPLRITTSRRAGELDGAELPRLRERQFLDGEGRLLQRRVPDALPGAPGTSEVIKVAHRYGARGLLVESYLPYAAPGSDYAPPDPDLPHATLSYDALDRPIRSERPDGGVTTVTYLPGRIEETDEAGHVTTRHLGADGRIERIEQHLDGRALTTTFRFDLRGSLVEEVDAAGNAVRFTYDCLGRNLRTTRPESTTVAVLDATGNPVETRAGSHSVFRTFDAAGRPKAVRHDASASPPVATFVYHDAGSPAPPDAGAHTAGGRLVRAEDEAGVTVLDYDERGRVARKTMTRAGQDPLTLEIRHRSDGLVDRVTYPDGSTADYRYDAAARLASISDAVEKIEYDRGDRRTSIRYANGVDQFDAHDALTGWRATSKLIGPGGSVLRDISFRHDAIGNVLRLTGATPADTWSYTYDDLSRLVSAHGLGAPAVGGPAAERDWVYAYDDVGNLQSASDVGAYTYGQAAQAPTLLTSTGAGAFSYDDRGHVVSAPWGTHAVDAEGRLRRVTLSAGPVHEYTYDHKGRLAVRHVTGIDGGGNAVDLEAWSPDGLLSVEGGEPLVQITDGQVVLARRRAKPPAGADTPVERTTFLHRDHLGSVVALTNGTGAVVRRVRYAPYGGVLERTGPAGDVPQGFGTGLLPGLGGLPAPDILLLGARWYAPAIGRFLSPDALVGDASDPAAWNAFAYCRGNPVSYVDPSGRGFWKIFGAILATIAIIAVVVIVSVMTFGVASPGAIALGVGGISVTWGAVFAATIIGVVAGGVIGGIAAARAGGDAGDILLGVLVGGAVGGWAAFGAAFAGPAVAGGFGLTGGTVAAGAVAGGVSGAINGAAMGFASGFAGGRNNGLKDIMEKVLVGAIIGLALGAALGALSGIKAPHETPQESLGKALRPDPPAPGSQGPAANIPSGGPPAAQPAPINNVGDAALEVGKRMAGRVGGALAPHIAEAISGFTGSIITQTVVVDLAAAGTSEFWDDLQEYLRTHHVKLGPFSFIKGDF